MKNLLLKCRFLATVSLLLINANCKETEPGKSVQNHYPSYYSGPFLLSLEKIAHHNQSQIHIYLEDVNRAKNALDNPNRVELDELYRFLKNKLDPTNDHLKSSYQALLNFIEINQDKQEYINPIKASQEFLENKINLVKLELPTLEQLDEKYNSSTAVFLPSEMLLKEQSTLKNHTIALFKQTTQLLEDQLKILQGIPTKSQEEEKIIQEKLSELIKTKKELEEKLKTLEDELEKKTAEAQQEQTKLKEQIQNLENSYQEEKTKLMQENQNLLARLEDEIQENEKRVKILEEENQAQQDRINKELEVNGLSKEDNKRLNEEKEKLELEKGKINADFTKARNEAEKAKAAQKNAHSEAINRIKEAHQKEKQDLQAQIKKINEENEENKKAREEAERIRQQQDLLKSEQEKNQLQIQVETLKADIKALEEQINTLTFEKDTREIYDFFQRLDQIITSNKIVLNKIKNINNTREGFLIYEIKEKFDSLDLFYIAKDLNKLEENIQRQKNLEKLKNIKNEIQNFCLQKNGNKNLDYLSLNESLKEENLQNLNTHLSYLIFYCKSLKNI
jgi:hypothetical protein